MTRTRTMADPDDLDVLRDTRDALHAHMADFRAGRADAESCGRVGFLGFATAYTVAVKNDIQRRKP